MRLNIPHFLDPFATVATAAPAPTLAAVPRFKKLNIPFLGADAFVPLFKNDVFLLDAGAFVPLFKNEAFFFTLPLNVGAFVPLFKNDVFLLDVGAFVPLFKNDAFFFTLPLNVGGGGAEFWG